MRSPLLALFVRSVRQDVRDGATYSARLGVGLFLYLALLIVLLSSSWTGAPGRGFFSTIIALQMFAITFMGLSYFASAIAEEKEEQTLGLLRMTGLDPLSILLGKSTSRLCGVLLFVTAQLPFTIFAITLGGISLRQVMAAYCTVAAFTFFLGNVALLGSVLARRTAGAVVFCICTPILLGIGWSILKGLEQITGGYHGLQWTLNRAAAAISAADPVGRLQEVLGTGFSGTAIGWQVIVDVAFGVVFFLLAWAGFERLCDRAPEKAFAVSRTSPAGKSAIRRWRLQWLQPSRVWKDALLWKDFYFLHGGRTAFAIRTLLYGGVVVGNIWQILHGGGPTSQMSTNGAPNSILPWFFSIDLAIMCGRIFRVELNEQTLGMLAVLPCSVRQLADRKVLACLLAAAPGAISCVVDEILFAVFPIDSTGHFSHGPIQTTTIVQLLGTGAAMVLLVCVVAWLSLSMKRGAAPLGCVLTGVSTIMMTGICMIIFTITLAAMNHPSGWWQWLGDFEVAAPALTALLSIGAAWMLRRGSIVRLEALTREN